MSDDWIRIVPSDPEHVPDAKRREALMPLLRDLMPDAHELSIESTEEIAFVDAGVNQGTPRCPSCGSSLAEKWWATAFATSYELSRFTDRQVVLPCCGASSDLNDLDYGEWPIAFARWWVDCMNPNVGRLDDEQIEAIARALGHPVTIVYQHI